MPILKACSDPVAFVQYFGLSLTPDTRHLKPKIVLDSTDSSHFLNNGVQQELKAA